MLTAKKSHFSAGVLIFFHRCLHLKQFFSLQTRKTASWLAAELSKEGHQVALLSGEMVVEQRAAVIERFREGKEKVLVTTNVCARGEQRPVPARQARGGRESFVCGRLRWFGGDAVLWVSLWGSGDRPQKPGVLAGGRGRRLLFLAPVRRQLLLQSLGSSRGSLADAGIWPAPGRPRPLPLGSASCPCPNPRAGLSQTLPAT